MKHRFAILRLAAIVLLAATLAAPAIRADTVAFDVSSRTILSTNANDDITYGYTFTLANPISVTQLGFYDYNANGLSTSIPVTLWNASGTTQASGTVPTTGTELNSYLYVSLTTPVTLPAGTYTIGGYVTGTDSVQASATITPAAGITYGAARSGMFNVYPTGNFDGYPNAYFGPNFQFISVAPEPSTWALVGIGAVSVGVLALRRRVGRA